MHALSLLLLAADLTIIPADQDHILLDFLSDTHCPLVCTTSDPRCPSPPCPDANPCCDTYRAIVENIETRGGADFLFDNGDLVVNTKIFDNPAHYDHFALYWDQITGPKGWGMGNHEAARGTDTTGTQYWIDPENHYAPANWLEPLYGCDSTTAIEDCPRWYSVHVGSPVRLAFFALSNNSDSSEDSTFYINPGVPFDSLHTPGSTQRNWLNAEIDSLPETVEAVFVSGHRPYYGVESVFARPNIILSADGEDQRTSPTSFLRDLESIYDRKPGVRWVFCMGGDQHCWSETKPIRENVTDFDGGVVYVVGGISGGRIDRAEPFPNMFKIPPGTLQHAFDDRWGSTRFELGPMELTMTVREAYTDSVLYQNAYSLGDVGAPPTPAGGLRVYPNPASVRVELAVPGDALTDLAIYDVTGRLVERLRRGTYRGGYAGTWDTRGVAPGRYYVRAVSGGTVRVAPVTVVR